MEREKISIGLLGFGNTGQILYDALGKTKGLKSGIRKICIKHLEKPMPMDMSFSSTENDEILNPSDSSIQTIENVENAIEIIKIAIRNKKTALSAGTKMRTEYLNELNRLSEENDLSLFFDNQWETGIPIIRNLEEYFDIELNFCFVLNQDQPLYS